MNNFRFLDSLVFTEKSSILSDKYGKFVFFSPVEFTKSQIKSMVKSAFKDLKISKISTAIVKGKKRKFRGCKGQGKDRKKVIVTTATGKMPDLKNL